MTNSEITENVSRRTNNILVDFTKCMSFIPLFDKRCPLPMKYRQNVNILSS